MLTLPHHSGAPAPKVFALPRPHTPGPALLRALADRAEDEELELAAAMLRLAGSLLAADHRGGLYRLTYVSHTEGGPDGELQRCGAILQVARARNAAAGITGALMHSPSWFGQVLEGGRQGVEATFARILRDNRHSDIRVLRMEPVRAREFAQWAMAEAGPGPDALMCHAAILHHRLGGETSAGLQGAARDIIDMLHTRLEP